MSAADRLAILAALERGPCSQSELMAEAACNSKRLTQELAHLKLQEFVVRTGTTRRPNVPGQQGVYAITTDGRLALGMGIVPTPVGQGIVGTRDAMTFDGWRAVWPDLWAPNARLPTGRVSRTHTLMRGSED